MTFQSLLQNSAESYINVLKDLTCSLGTCDSLYEIAERLNGQLMFLGRQLLSLVSEVLSESFYEDKNSRKELGLEVKERGRKKIVYTIFGSTELRNDIYVNKAAEADGTTLPQSGSGSPRSQAASEDL